VKISTSICSVWPIICLRVGGDDEKLVNVMNKKKDMKGTRMMSRN